MYRTSLEEVESISKTDTTQSWVRVSEAAANRCNPSQMSNLCHVSEPIMKYPPLVLTREIQEDIFQGLIGSSIIQHSVIQRFTADTNEQFPLKFHCSFSSFNIGKNI